MDKYSFNILSVLVVLACFATACTGSPITPTPTARPALPSATPEPPTDTPEPTATATPLLTDTPEPAASSTPTLDLTATAQAEATQAAEAVIAEIGKELEAVELSTDTGYLLWAQDEPVSIELDEYQEWTSEPFANDLPASDFVLKSDITWESTGGLVTCELVFRSEKNMEEGKHYLFEMVRLSGLPVWSISYLQYGEYQKAISESRANSAINQDQGSTNKVVIIAEGEKFTVYINDIRAGSFYDYSKSMEEGYFAYSAWQESGKSTCTFDNTWVWALK